MKRFKKQIVYLLVCIMFLASLSELKSVQAADKKYGIIIADKTGSYSFYDLSSTGKTPGIEITSNGSIMVPIKKLCDLMPDLMVKVDSSTKKVSVINKYNGKKVVFTKNSKDFYYYSSRNAKGIKKSAPYQMYTSAKSSVSMIHMSVLKWVMGTATGVKSFKTAEMQTAGFDTYTYNGLIAYNPYGSVTVLPKAAKVKNISATVKITVPEGYSVSQTFDLLVKKGVCASAAELYQAMENYDFSYYPLVSKIGTDPNRCFKLEGYLFPDTYEFYRLSKPQDVIGKFLRNTESRITADDRSKAASLGYSVDEILTIASLIEKETGNPEYMRNISSILFNRLNKKMKLQLDASIFYVERYLKPYITGDINRYNSYYNTYKCSALPAGPICNPGKNAIRAALNPAVTNYFYFYSDSSGNYYFSETYDEIKSIMSNNP